MLSETQTPATLHQQLPNHIVHTIPASTVSRRAAVSTGCLLVATAQGHAVLAGDFNARVGSLPDPWVADMGDSIPPQLQNTDSTVNAHGRKLMRLCADSAMILCTGRTLADTPAQPTFKARTNTVASRLDHVLVDPGLFSFIQ
ncbi:TPA: hypothetical protein ACH3X3_004214 [Trebouxia sp. C0006]